MKMTSLIATTGLEKRTRKSLLSQPGASLHQRRIRAAFQALTRPTSTD
jgi:hypothetical protein